MPVAALFASHTPLKDYHSAGREVERDVEACLNGVRDWIAAFDPELVIACGPDHFNGFFYRLMPSFCIGTAADSVGDWNTPAGPLPVAGAIAEACVRSVQADGVDVAISYRMEVDHGMTQLLSQVFSWNALPPLLPVFINCAAPPLPPLARVFAFGQALGRFAARRSARILIAASGGLSHDPPIPVLGTATDAVRERLIAGAVLSPEARASRQARVLEDAASQVAGTSDRTPLNPAWDVEFLRQLRAFEVERITAMDDAAITAAGGCGGHEIRTWIAVAAAARAAGVATFDLKYYRAIPEWVAGYAVMTAGAAA